MYPTVQKIFSVTLLLGHEVLNFYINITLIFCNMRHFSDLKKCKNNIAKLKWSRSFLFRNNEKLKHDNIFHESHMVNSITKSYLNNIFEYSKRFQF